MQSLKVQSLIPALLLALTVAAAAAPPAGYKLVWSDEFNGSALDTNHWYYRTGPRLLSYQTPENVSVTNGWLRLALRQQDAGGLHYTAGGVISRRQFTYGYFEARFRCPKSAGWHTSFWGAIGSGSMLFRDGDDITLPEPEVVLMRMGLPPVPALPWERRASGDRSFRRQAHGAELTMGRRAVVRKL